MLKTTQRDVGQKGYLIYSIGLFGCHSTQIKKYALKRRIQFHESTPRKIN